MKYNASVNIEIGVGDDFGYIVTPNAERVLGDLVSNLNLGVHSFSIIGTYGTGKSSFLLALEKGLCGKDTRLVKDRTVFFGKSKFNIINIVGEYAPLQKILERRIGSEGRNTLEVLKDLIKSSALKGKALVIAIDEFGKVLEHAAKNNPEEELYFIQQLCEIINDHRREAMLITTLHQNFGTYSSGLTQMQRNEWQKVKGRFKEIVFAEPVEQLLYLAAEQIESVPTDRAVLDNLAELYRIARKSKVIAESFSLETALKIGPLDAFAAQCLTLAIQRYGQNERSLFSFLGNGGRYSFGGFHAQEHLTYNLSTVYDYLVYNFYSEISEVNLDSTGWAAIKVALGRVESGIVPNDEIEPCSQIVKTIGLLNIFGSSDMSLPKDVLVSYASLALGIENPEDKIKRLESSKVIRFASYKSQYILFEGTDVDIESELLRAALIVPRPTASVEELKDYVDPKVSSASATFYRRGTPRYFEFIMLNEPEIKNPEGDVDGFCEMILPLDDQCGKRVKEMSSQNRFANIYILFNTVGTISGHLHEIKKLQYLLDNVAIDDPVAKKEITSIQNHEKNKLNAALNDCLFSGDGSVTWYFEGEVVPVSSRRDYNKLVSHVCDSVYTKTPVMRNELFNRQKLSSAISLAKSNLLDALLAHPEEEDLGFPIDSFPPEKTIYLSLLKNTGTHRADEDGFFTFGRPTDEDVIELWNICDEFIESTSSRPRKVSELIKLLQSAPFKLKQGFIDFWIPIFLYIRQQDFALYGASGNYIMNINKDFFNLLWKSPSSFSIKAFNVEGIKLDFFRKYRQFLRKDDTVNISKDSFSSTFKPFLIYYKGLNEYAKNTVKFDNINVRKFRDVLSKATDPEKAFFEDLPEALGYKGNYLAPDDEFIQDYLEKIREAVKELNACYPELLNRIESRMTEQLGLPKVFTEYKPLLESRYANVKKHLLTQKARTFLDRVIAPASTREEFIERISSSILDKQLYKLKDKEEEALLDNMMYLFYELDRYSELSVKGGESTTDDLIYSFDLLNNAGTNERLKTYRLPEPQKEMLAEKKAELLQRLSGDKNLDICVLLDLLADQLKDR